MRGPFWCAFFLGLLAAFSACSRSSVIVVDGIEIYESIWKETQAEIGRRVAFDFDCPQEKLTFTLFKKEGRHPTEVGVKGCGDRFVFVRAIGLYEAGPWVLNTSSATDGP